MTLLIAFEWAVAITILVAVAFIFLVLWAHYVPFTL